MRGKITKSLVDGITADGKPLVVFDTELSGFCLKVTPAGHRTYQLRYRMGGRGTALKTYTIARHGQMTPDQARRTAQTLIGDIRRGIDPAAEKARKAFEERGALSIEVLARDFLEIYCKPRLKPRSFVEYKRAIRSYIVPRLGQIKVAALTHGDVERLHHSMRDTQVTANRTIQVLSKFMSWSIRGGFRPDRQNPCQGLERFKEQPRQRYLSPAEIEAVGRAIRELEAASELSPWQAALFRCFLLTGMRSSELRLLRWDWVDFDAALFRLPDSKVGKRDIPIAAPVLQILQWLPRIEGCPYVFAGRAAGKPLANTRWPWRKILARAGIPAARVHDLRHSTASIGVTTGASLLLIGGVLGHKSQQTTQRYAHLADDPVRATTEAIAERVAKALDGAPSAEVVPMRKRP